MEQFLIKRARAAALSLCHEPRTITHAGTDARIQTRAMHMRMPMRKRKKDTKTQNRRKTGAKDAKKTHKVCEFPYFLCVTHVHAHTHGHTLFLSHAGKHTHTLTHTHTHTHTLNGACRRYLCSHHSWNAQNTATAAATTRSRAPSPPHPPSRSAQEASSIATRNRGACCSPKKKRCTASW